VQFVRGVRRSAHELVADPALAPAAAGNPAPAPFSRRGPGRMAPTWARRVSQRLRMALDRIPTPTPAFRRFLEGTQVVLGVMAIAISIIGVISRSGLDILTVVLVVLAGLAVATTAALLRSRR
jgi:hypothetical protein